MDEFNFEALFENLIYVLKESQIKIGYTDNAASLNYPPASLARLLGIEQNEALLHRALEEFSLYAESVLGRISIGSYDGQYCLTIPSKGVRYVHEKVEESSFLRELIDGVMQHRLKNIDEVLALFCRYSDKVMCEKTEGDGYDHVLYFEDGQPDSFVYLFETAFNHISYHRMTKADYAAELG